jgi:hypothetical protein
MAGMAKSGNLIEVQCPCCDATLKVDPQTEAVISFKAAVKPRSVEDFSDALARVKGEASRREEAFLKSVEAEKKSKDVLARKFDELLKQAKETPDLKPPTRDIDLD